MDLYIDSPTTLYGVVLNYLSTGTTLPFTYNVYGKVTIDMNTIHRLSHVTLLIVKLLLPYR
jgi:hypothetical protein